MGYGFSSVSPCFWSHANSFKWKTNTGAYRIYLYTSNSPGAARTCASLRTHNPSPKSVMETDDQHFALKAQGRQCSWELQPLQTHCGSPLVQLMKLFKDQGRNRVTSAVSLSWSAPQSFPGPSDLCVSPLAGLHNLVEPSTPWPNWTKHCFPASLPHMWIPINLAEFLHASPTYHLTHSLFV